jgi:hypothetical protein
MRIERRLHAAAPLRAKANAGGLADSDISVPRGKVRVQAGAGKNGRWLTLDITILILFVQDKQ